MTISAPDDEFGPLPWLTDWITRHEADLIDVRRTLHAHPELSFAEHMTTALLVNRLATAGLRPRVLPEGTGVVVDIGDGPRSVALRADLDALPIQDLKDVPYRSTVDGASHACGHDVHTTIGLGAALALAEHAAVPPAHDGAPRFPGRVRVIFQPAEELLPGGALRVIEAGELDGIEHLFALHCDPRIDVGQVGVRLGALTAACDSIEVAVTGPGGHTARPHLTVDIVDVLARIAVETPHLFSRRVDARARASLVWGVIQAGSAANAIPRSGQLRGTVRVLNRDVWAEAEELIPSLIESVAATSGATVDVRYVRGVPPVVNDAESVRFLQGAVSSQVGADAAVPTATSMGGEDFAWYGEHVPLAMGRLGVRAPSGPVYDLHQGTFDVDERAIGIGIRTLVGAALAALH